MTDEILLKLIQSNPDQPRKHFDEAKMEELARSMQAQGLIVPILVRPVEDRFAIVHGERRFRAARSLQWKTIRAEIRDVSPAEGFRLALIENIQREDLSPIEEAEAFVKLKDGGMTQTEIGDFIGKSQPYVAERLSLLRLPDNIQDFIIARSINPSVGRLLATVKDKRVQRELAEAVAKGTMSVREVKDKIKTCREIQKVRNKQLEQARKLLIEIGEVPFEVAEAAWVNDITIQQLTLHFKELNEMFIEISGQQFDLASVRRETRDHFRRELMKFLVFFRRVEEAVFEVVEYAGDPPGRGDPGGGEVEGGGRYDNPTASKRSPKEGRGGY